MNELLKTVTKQIAFTLPVMRKYVDDLILALPRIEVENTLKLFNSYNTHIQFTMEVENNNSIPFLDTLVIRNNDQTLTTEWYQKSIASGRVLNYFSFHPTTMKMNVAYNFIKRVMQLTQTNNIQRQRQIIMNTLKSNNYPHTLINRLINRVQHCVTRGTPTAQPQTAPQAATQPATTQVAEQSVCYRSIPYVPALSNKINRFLQRDYANVKVGMRTVQPLKRLFKSVKDPVNMLQKYNVVYCTPCGQCDMVYIGMTTNMLKVRLSGHRANIKKYEELKAAQAPAHTTSPELAALAEKTALLKHAIQYQHTFELDKTEILDTTFRASSLPILEICYISSNAHTVNQRTDVDGLHSSYAGILHSLSPVNAKRNGEPGG